MNSIINYINSFFYKDEDLNILYNINFQNMNNNDILYLLNIIKSSKSTEEIYNIKLYYENQYNKDPFDQLSKLKYKLILYLDSEKDKTENILYEIKKYKDPEIVKLEKKFIKLKDDINYILLEKRYNNLIKDCDDDTDDETNNNNNNSTGILVKKKIALLL